MNKIDATAAFVNRWTAEHVNATHFDPSDDIIDSLADQLIAGAAKEGITVADLQEVGTPRDIIKDAWGDGMYDAQERWLDKNP